MCVAKVCSPRLRIRGIITALVFVTAATAVGAPGSGRAAAGSIAVPPPPTISDVMPRGRAATVFFDHVPTLFNEEYSVRVLPVVVPDVSHPAECTEAVRIVADPGSVAFEELCAGVPYTVSVTARNDFESTDSVVSPIFVPLAPQPPMAPALHSVAGSDHNLAIRWILLDDGGASITRVVVTADDGAHATIRREALGSSNGTVLRGVPRGVYRISLVAVNAVGSSRTTRGSVVVGPPPTPAPRAMSVEPGQFAGQLQVSFCTNLTSEAVVPGAIVTTIPVLKERATDGSVRYVRRPGGVVRRLLTHGGCRSTVAVTGLVPERLYLAVVALVGSQGIGPPIFQRVAVAPSPRRNAAQVVLRGDELAALDDFDGTTLHWDAPAPAGLAAAPAGAIVRSHPYAVSEVGWLFARITAVRQLAGGALEIDIGPANLGDAYERVAAWASTSTPLWHGDRVETVDTTLGDGGRVSGHVRIDSTTTGGFALRRSGTEATVRLVTMFDVVTDIEFIAPGAVSERIQLREPVGGSLDLRSVDTDFRAAIPAQITVSTSARVSAHVATHSIIGVELAWDSQRPGALRFVRTFERHDAQTSPTVSLSSAVGVDVGVEFFPTFRIREQELAGIDVESATHVQVLPDALAPDPYLAMTTTTRGAARMLAQARGDHAVLSAALAPVATSIVNLDSPTPLSTMRIVGGAVTVAAGGSVQLDAIDLLGGPVAVSWSIRGGVTADAISADGVLDAALPAQRRIVVVATAADGREDFVVVAVA